MNVVEGDGDFVVVDDAMLLRAMSILLLVLLLSSLKRRHVYPPPSEHPARRWFVFFVFEIKSSVTTKIYRGENKAGRVLFSFYYQYSLTHY